MKKPNNLKFQRWCIKHLSSVITWQKISQTNHNPEKYCFSNSGFLNTYICVIHFSIVCLFLAFTILCCSLLSERGIFEKKQTAKLLRFPDLTSVSSKCLFGSILLAAEKEALLFPSTCIVGMVWENLTAGRSSGSWAFLVMHRKLFFTSFYQSHFCFCKKPTGEKNGFLLQVPWFFFFSLVFLSSLLLVAAELISWGLQGGQWWQHKNCITSLTMGGS